MSPAGSAPNGNLLNLYLPNWHANVVRYDDFPSNFKFWYPELASIIERYCTLSNFGKISFSAVPLCTGLISAWFSLAGSRHSLPFPFRFGTNTKPLYHSAVLSMPSDVMISCCCKHSNSSLNSCCRAYATFLWGPWYGLLSDLTCNQKVLSKHPIPLNISLNSLCSCCVILSLAFLLA